MPQTSLILKAPNVTVRSFFKTYLIMTRSSTEKTPSHHNAKLNNAYGVQINIMDTFPNVLERAKKVADDYNAPVSEIEKQMKILFHHPYIYPDIVETYNRLEKKWKILTNYRTNDKRAVSWQE